MQRSWLGLPVGLTVLVVSSFLPWARTGLRKRSSYELIGLTRRLGLINQTWLAGLARAWFALPLLSGVALAAVIMTHRRTAVALAAVAATGTLLLVWRVKIAPLRAEVGTDVAVAGAIMTVLGSIPVVAAPRGQSQGETS